MEGSLFDRHFVQCQCEAKQEQHTWNVKQTRKAFGFL